MNKRRKFKEGDVVMITWKCKYQGQLGTVVGRMEGFDVLYDVLIDHGVQSFLEADLSLVRSAI